MVRHTLAAGLLTIISFVSVTAQAPVDEFERTRQDALKRMRKLVADAKEISDAKSRVRVLSVMLEFRQTTGATGEKRGRSIALH